MQTHWTGVKAAGMEVPCAARDKQAGRRQMAGEQAGRLPGGGCPFCARRRFGGSRGGSWGQGARCANEVARPGTGSLEHPWSTPQALCRAGKCQEDRVLPS